MILLVLVVVPIVLVVAGLYVGMSRFGVLPVVDRSEPGPTPAGWGAATGSGPAGSGSGGSAGADWAHVPLRRYGYEAGADGSDSVLGRLDDVPQGCLLALVVAMALWVLAWMALLVVGLVLVYG